MRSASFFLLVVIAQTTCALADAPRFERDVLPILARHCHACHGAENPRRGLDLRSIQSLVNGGLSGLIAVPGKPEQSYLLHMVRRETMPPRGRSKLSKSEIETIRTWISGGMPADAAYTIPRPADAVSEDDRSHWAFQPLANPTPPAVASRESAANPVDAFVASRLHGKRLQLAPTADRRTLHRRLLLDLLGRPPTPAEQRHFLADQRSDAWERLVDATLASPEFGPRFGRHWLDVAGYADTVGFDHVPHLVIIPEGKWRYRDYVINSFNDDHRFDRFLQEQLAGDEMVPWRTERTYSDETIRHLVATGFLRTARDQTHEGVGVITPNYYEVLFETMDVVAGGLLGLSVKCARCHDHKFDAIPQRDYYRLMASLVTSYNPSEWRPVYRFAPDVQERSLADVSDTTRREIDAHNTNIAKQVDVLKKDINATRQAARNRVRSRKQAVIPDTIRADTLAALATDGAKRTTIQKYLAERFEKLLSVSDEEVTAALKNSEAQQIATAKRQISHLETSKRQYGRIQALFDIGTAPTTFVLTRGDHRYPAAPVEPGFLSVLTDRPEESLMKPEPRFKGTSGRRLALARWLTRPGTRVSALVSRVLVNRFWQALFGQGLVKTSGDFGIQGTPPTHPQLLDWLASDFQRRGWRVKPLLRHLLLSHTYRQTSRPAPSPATTHARRVDPDNRLLWHMPMRRLESESIRDSLLAVSGQLDRSLGGPPVPQSSHSDGSITVNTGALARPFDRWRRSIYLVTRRGYSISLLQVFDQPSILTTCSTREASAVPLQSLAMINGPFVNRTAERLARQLSIKSSQTEDGQEGHLSIRRVIASLYLQVLCRPPDDVEVDLCEAAWAQNRDTFVASGKSRRESETMALVELCHTLLNTSEFLYRE